jgi:hypothetical protein
VVSVISEEPEWEIPEPMISEGFDQTAETLCCIVDIYRPARKFSMGPRRQEICDIAPSDGHAAHTLEHPDHPEKGPVVELVYDYAKSSMLASEIPNPCLLEQIPIRQRKRCERDA